MLRHAVLCCAALIAEHNVGSFSAGAGAVSSFTADEAGLEGKVSCMHISLMLLSRLTLLVHLRFSITCE